MPLSHTTPVAGLASDHGVWADQDRVDADRSAGRAERERAGRRPRAQIPGAIGGSHPPPPLHQRDLRQPGGAGLARPLVVNEVVGKVRLRTHLELVRLDPGRIGHGRPLERHVTVVREAGVVDRPDRHAVRRPSRSPLLSSSSASFSTYPSTAPTASPFPCVASYAFGVISRSVEPVPPATTTVLPADVIHQRRHQERIRVVVQAAEEGRVQQRRAVAAEARQETVASGRHASDRRPRASSERGFAPCARR